MYYDGLVNKVVAFHFTMIQLLFTAWMVQNLSGKILISEFKMKILSMISTSVSQEFNIYMYQNHSLLNSEKY